jgi:hypothetical protein
MSQAFAVVTRNSPGVAQTVVNISSQALQSAVADHADEVGYQLGRDGTIPSDQPAGDGDHAPAATPEVPSEPRTQDPASLGQTAGPTSWPMSSMSTYVPLHPLGTRISMQLQPSILPSQLDQEQWAWLQVTMPPPFCLQSLNQEPAVGGMQP